LGFRIGGLVQRSSGASGLGATQVSIVDLRSGDAFNIGKTAVLAPAAAASMNVASSMPSHP
jgi:hypothetical protein